MLQRDRQIRAQLHQLADACLVALSFWVAYQLRASPTLQDALGLPVIPPDFFDNLNSVLFVLALIPTTPLVFESQGLYKHPPICPRRAFLWPLFKGCLLTTMGLVLVSFALHINMPRTVIVWFGVISFAMIWIKEEALLLLYKTQYAQEQFKRRFILAGTEQEIARISRELERRGDPTVAVVAQFDLGARPLPELVQMIHDHSVYGVILSAKHTYFEQIENVIRACELEGVEVWLLADFFTTQISRTSLDELLGRPLLTFRSTPGLSWPAIAKQVLDIVGALVLLVLLLPVLLVIALVIKVTSPGPVLFKQQRSGQNGKPFTLYKFRTMVTNAEQLRHELEAMNEMRGPVFKLSRDPRVTRVGKFLRKYSLDELPQLWNVLRGEMSLVGPRPLPVDEVKRFHDLAHRRRLSVKPGLTCLWQVSGRNEISDFREWVRLDLEYIDHWSLWLDLKILLLTIPAVLRGTGAR
ncbi:MAG TPA: sugar transferase [Verrucomicrobiae bacterium]|nr:sugar transferase [Verrucomicrobiae bacterium]